MIVKKYKADTETAAILAAKEVLPDFLNMIMWKSQPLWKKKNLNRK